jgi:hypothetical protein
MLDYSNINKFYPGGDIENTTPLTSDYLNNIINQIEKNFNNLDDRLEKIENLIVNKTINVDVANIKTGNIDLLNTINGNITNLNSDKITIKNGEISVLDAEDIKVKKLETSNIIAGNANIESLLSNYAKINELHLESLKISDKYMFKTNAIEFYGDQPGIKFKVSEGSNGLRFDSEDRIDKNARVEFDKTNKNFTIEYLADSEDEFNINTNTKLSISADVIELKTNIKPTKNIEIGSIDNPMEKICSNQFYGSYFSFNADIAELYQADIMYPPGTLLCVGDKTEATIYDPNNPRPILGVVSTKPAIILNKEDKRDFMVSIALKGRIPCLLSKEGNRGDYIVPDDKIAGYCKPTSEKQDNVIGILIDPINNIIKV